MKIIRFSLSQFHKEGGRLTIRSITFVFLVIVSSRSEQYLCWKGNILKPLFNLVHVLTYSIRCQILLSTPDALYNYMQVIKNFIRNFDTKKMHCQTSCNTAQGLSFSSSFQTIKSPFGLGKPIKFGIRFR